ncbi:MAG: hypothetical protein ACSHXZ_14850, partial [Gammaproteobacteria bacterium]
MKRRPNGRRFMFQPVKLTRNPSPGLGLVRASVAGLSCCGFRGHRDKVFMRLEISNDEKSL